MFTTTVRSSWPERSRFGVTAIACFGVQAIAVVTLLMIPLLHPDGMPLLRRISAPVSLGQPGDAVPVRARPGASTVLPSPAIVLRPSAPIYRAGRPAVDDNSAPQIAPGGTFSGGGSGSPGIDGIFRSFGSGPPPVMPSRPYSPKSALVHVSQMSEGSLAFKVVPTYPPLAKAARIQGQVLLQAIISKQGTIEKLQAVSGPPMLVEAAVASVKQWRYRPYILNGEPVEVETQITVNFSLAGN